MVFFLGVTFDRRLVTDAVEGGARALHLIG
jgi:hypothetical protein